MSRPVRWRLLPWTSWRQLLSEEFISGIEPGGVLQGESAGAVGRGSKLQSLTVLIMDAIAFIDQKRNMNN